MTASQAVASTRPYLIRALHEWCCDNGLTPYVAVRVGEGVQVPREFVKNGEIVLNVSLDATSALKLGNEFIEFKARFGGVAREVIVPVSRVMAIYARENGQGMAFPLEEPAPADAPEAATPLPLATEAPSVPEARPPVQLSRVDSARDEDQPEPPRPGGSARPALKRVK